MGGTTTCPPSMTSPLNAASPETDRGGEGAGAAIAPTRTPIRRTGPMALGMPAGPADGSGWECPALRCPSVPLLLARGAEAGAGNGRRTTRSD